MSTFGSRIDRKRNLSFLGGRMVAVVVITVVAALSFTLGYNVGRSGLDGKDTSGQVQVVPEGAGLVLLGDSSACQEAYAARNSSATASQSDPSSVALLETIKAASAPEPDPMRVGAGPDEPVLEPLGEQSATAPKEKPQGERRVAPISQLPAKKTEPSAEKADAPVSPAVSPRAQPSSTSTARTVPSAKKPARDKPADVSTSTVAQRKPVPAKRPAVSSDGRSYSVQIGAFKSLNDARTHRIRFTNKGYKASVYKDRSSDGSDIFKVRIGIFTSRQDAEAMALKLKNSEGVNGFVTPIQ